MRALYKNLVGGTAPLAVTAGVLLAAPQEAATQPTSQPWLLPATRPLLRPPTPPSTQPAAPPFTGPLLPVPVLPPEPPPQVITINGRRG